MRLRSDDPIHGHQGRWIDNRGKEMPAHVRYHAIPPFALLLVPCLLVVRLAGFGFVLTVFVGAALAGLGARFVADEVTSETGFTGWAGIARAEWVARRVRRRELRSRRPRRAWGQATSRKATR